MARSSRKNSSTTWADNASGRGIHRTTRMNPPRSYKQRYRLKSLPYSKPLLPVAIVMSLCAPFAAQTATKHFSASAQRFQTKLDFIDRNAKSSPVQRRSTQINADEVNAWFREGGYKLPQGVEKVTFHSQPETIIADTTVDFDAVKQGKRNLNPLLSMFSGVHEVQVTATAAAQNGQGHVVIQSVSIDEV